MPNLMPHGMCLLWNSKLILAHVIPDALVALSYYTIPVVLFMVRRRLTDVASRLVLMMFVLFILACGTTHVMDIVTLYYPVYWAQAYVKVWTAAMSVSTAVWLLRGVPTLLGVTE